jgi:hypothetical protein
VTGRNAVRLAAFAGALACAGCGVPHFDVPTDTAGQPTVTTIIDRVTCELRDMVRDDRAQDVASFHRLFLLNGDYDVAVSLSLEVNESGGLAPSLSYISPISKAASFMFGGNAALSESRDHNFTENIQISTRKIFSEWKGRVKTFDCPQADTNLAGTLGIKDFVAMAALTDRNLGPQPAAGQPSSTTQFGGSVQFVVTKNLTSVGPTWSLVHFKGPGGLASISQVDTDKVTFAFAQGPNVGKPISLVTNAPNPDANRLLQQILTNSINTQLQMLQNSVQ